MVDEPNINDSEATVVIRSVVWLGSEYLRIYGEEGESVASEEVMWGLDNGIGGEVDSIYLG